MTNPARAVAVVSAPILLLLSSILRSSHAGEMKFSLSQGSIRGSPVIHLNVCGSLDLGPPLEDLGGDQTSFGVESIDFFAITATENDESLKMQGSCGREGSKYPCTDYASRVFAIPSNEAASVTVDMRDCAEVNFRLLQSSSPFLPWRRLGFDISPSSERTVFEFPPALDVNATTISLEGSSTMDKLPALQKEATLENLSLVSGATCFIQWKSDNGSWQKMSLVVEESFRPCDPDSDFKPSISSPGGSSSNNSNSNNNDNVPEFKEFRLGPGCWCPRAGWFPCLILALTFVLTGECPQE